MSKEFFYLLVSVLFFVSCNKEDEDVSSSPTPFRGALSGVIEGEYASWDNVGISFEESGIVETTPIVDGKFTFLSLPTPKPEDLKPFIDSEAPIDNMDFFISDRDAKVCNLSFLARKGGEGRGIVQGTWDFLQNSANMFMYYYADKDLIIKFSWVWTDMEGKNSKSEVDINLKRGWNTLYLVTNDSKEGTLTIWKNGVPPSGTAWTGVVF